MYFSSSLGDFKIYLAMFQINCKKIPFRFHYCLSLKRFSITVVSAISDVMPNILVLPCS